MCDEPQTECWVNIVCYRKHYQFLKIAVIYSCDITNVATPYCAVALGLLGFWAFHVLRFDTRFGFLTHFRGLRVGMGPYFLRDHLSGPQPAASTAAHGFSIRYVCCAEMSRNGRDRGQNIKYRPEVDTDTVQTQRNWWRIPINPPDQPDGARRVPPGNALRSCILFPFSAV